MDPNVLFSEAARITSRSAVSVAYDEQRSLAGHAANGQSPGGTSRERPRPVERAQQERVEQLVRDPVHRYRDATAYRAAVGRDAPRDQVIKFR